jgi:hypothetical protein
LNQTMTSSDFLTDQQLAARWQIHRQTLLRWRRQLTGPAYVRIEGRVLYPLAEVEQYEKGQHHHPRSTMTFKVKGAIFKNTPEKLQQRLGDRFDASKKYPDVDGVFWHQGGRPDGLCQLCDECRAQRQR